MTMTSQALDRNAQADRAGLSRLRTVKSRRIALSWRAVVNFFVPFGYQDERGFHYGSQVRSAECGIKYCD
jgi:hypothetical protein